MGMGDKKKKYEPHYGKVLDVVYNKYFSECAVQECPHPAVIKRYGTGGVATVSIYTCKKCKFGVKSEWCGGWSCGYAMEKPVSSTEDGRLEGHSE